MDPARARKLGGRIAQIVAEMLERRIKDPRLGFVTVTEARLTNDLREATVFYTVYGSAEERAGTAVALASAVGVIRSEIGRQTGLRHTPSLEFRPDTVPDNARNIEELVARAREADAAVAAVREGAQPAGDADPYRVPARADEDFADEDLADEALPGADEALPGDEPAAGDPADRGPAGRPGQEDHLAETPAPGERGAGYSRS
jgi:ribosome-binding factor A